MKTKLLSLAFLFLIVNLHSQSVFSGRVVDAVNQDPIPFVNIGIKDASTGTVSDLDGNFSLKTSDENTVIVISAIGYETKEITTKILSQNKTIGLKEKAYTIPALEIKASSFAKEAQIYGVKNKVRGNTVGFGNPQLGTQIGALIYIDRPTLIKSANFDLVHAKGDSLLLRLNIYEYKDGKVGENILKENVLLKEKQRKGTFTIDLSNYDLILEHSVMLSLEWLQDFNGRGNEDITFDTKRGKKLKGLYFKVSNTSEFVKLPYKKSLKPCIYFMGKPAM